MSAGENIDMEAEVGVEGPPAAGNKRTKTQNLVTRSSPYPPDVEGPLYLSGAGRYQQLH